MKAYTDLEQSKKLAEILPLESADMFYSPVPVREWKDKTDISKGTHVVFKDRIFAIEDLPNHEIGEGDVYAWSLAALFNYLRETDFFPNIEVDEHSISMSISYYDEEEARPLAPVHNVIVEADTFVDACVAMIERLHEKNIL